MSSLTRKEKYKVKSTLNFLTLFTLWFVVGHLFAEQLPNIGQKDKKFSVDQLAVKVGETVTFTNEDPFFHNVFSLSPAATFDLGSYPQGESRSVTFDEAGVVHIECAIHPSMQMVIEVAE